GPQLVVRAQRAQPELGGPPLIRHGARTDHRAGLSPDPAPAARFRRDRLLAPRHPDPDPGAEEASERGRSSILLRRMTAKRIDGKAAAAALRERVAEGVRAFEQSVGRAPGLATVLVGEDPASAV